MLQAAYARYVHTCSVFKFPRGGEGDIPEESEGELQKVFHDVEKSNLNIFGGHKFAMVFWRFEMRVVVH